MGTVSVYVASEIITGVSGEELEGSARLCYSFFCVDRNLIIPLLGSNMIALHRESAMDQGAAPVMHPTYFPGPRAPNPLTPVAPGARGEEDVTEASGVLSSNHGG